MQMAINSEFIRVEWKFRKGQTGRKNKSEQKQRRGFQKKIVIEKSTLGNSQNEPKKQRKDTFGKKLELCIFGMIEHPIPKVYSKFMWKYNTLGIWETRVNFERSKISNGWWKWIFHWTLVTLMWSSTSSSFARYSSWNFYFLEIQLIEFELGLGRVGALTGKTSEANIADSKKKSPTHMASG